jgi:hypothetical protein
MIFKVKKNTGYRGLFRFLTIWYVSREGLHYSNFWRVTSREVPVWCVSTSVSFKRVSVQYALLEVLTCTYFLSNTRCEYYFINSCVFFISYKLCLHVYLGHRRSPYLRLQIQSCNGYLAIAGVQSDVTLLFVCYFLASCLHHKYSCRWEW